MGRHTLLGLLSLDLFECFNKYDKIFKIFTVYNIFPLVCNNKLQAHQILYLSFITWFGITYLILNSCPFDIIVSLQNGDK